MQNNVTKKTRLAPKQKSYFWWAVITLCISAVIVCAGIFIGRTVQKTEYIQATIGTEIFTLEIANTEVARERGLSERDALGKNEGMLFDFNQVGDWRIWMLQMRFPIDIAWLNEQKNIITIKHNAIPADYPDVYRATQPSRYVIEVPAGTFKRLDMQEGDNIRF